MHTSFYLVTILVWLQLLFEAQSIKKSFSPHSCHVNELSSVSHISGVFFCQFFCAVEFFIVMYGVYGQYLLYGAIIRIPSFEVSGFVIRSFASPYNSVVVFTYIRIMHLSMETPTIPPSGHQGAYQGI